MASMHPQPGLFAFGTEEHCYLELDLVEGADPLELASRLAALLGPDTPLVAVSCVVGLRPELWEAICPGTSPAGTTSFTGVRGPEVVMPATQHDAWIWLAGSERDAVFDSALSATTSLENVASVATEVSGWTHQRHRDLTGFIDGTENPPLLEAPAVACVADDPAAGASVLLFQQWEHSPSFAKLPVREQEAVIGRTKADSIELDESVMPADSHVSRNVVEEDGEELEIFRRNTSWGGPARHGTMFVGFCSSTHPLQVMLERMAGIPDGIRDALTRYTEALSGAYYVVPALDALLGLLPEE